MGRVSHQDMFSFDNHGCICDQLMGEDDDCCNDEVALVAFEEDQQVSSRLLHITPKLAVLFVFDLEGEFGLNATNTDQLNIAHLVDPPPKNRQPLYLIYSNYTFYG